MLLLFGETQDGYRYVDWALERAEFTAADLHYFAIESVFSGVGDWVFAGAARGSFLARARVHRADPAAGPVP